jgi:transposase-like protein
MGLVNMRVMMTETGFVKSMSTLWRGFGPSYVRRLRPHRGISQEKLPLYLGFFEFVHNAKKRGKALLSALLEALLL